MPPDVSMDIVDRPIGLHKHPPTDNLARVDGNRRRPSFSLPSLNFRRRIPSTPSLCNIPFGAHVEPYTSSMVLVDGSRRPLLAISSSQRPSPTTHPSATHRWRRRFPSTPPPQLLTSSVDAFQPTLRLLPRWFPSTRVTPIPPIPLPNVRRRQPKHVDGSRRRPFSLHYPSLRHV